METKRKKKDKNTWRGVTLLSVETKLLAAIIASRLQQWMDPWLYENQSGFRRGRGVDDTLQVVRKVIEQAARDKGVDWVALSFLGIEKAYSRVAKDAMWKLLRRRGCNEKTIKICIALHEKKLTKSRCWGAHLLAGSQTGDLREGCPSPPPLFNICHDAAMQDGERKRQQRKGIHQNWSGITSWMAG